jgi:fructokinase
MKIVCYGELMIDMIAEEKGNLQEANIFRKKAGGAAANVAAQIAKLGGDAAFIGKLGDDAFGRYLLAYVKQFHIDTSAVILDSARRTTVAFVGLSKEGIPDYLFYKEGGAANTISAKEIDTEYLLKADVLYSSSLMLTAPGVRETTKWIFSFAKEHGIKIAFDLNLRLTAWTDKETAKDVILPVLRQVDILKINDTELEFITERPVKFPDDGEKLFHTLEQLEILIITCGEKGSWIFEKGREFVYIPAEKTTVLDTTGAGDSYFGAFLTAYEAYGRNTASLADIGRWAAAAAELTIQGAGVIPVMPDRGELQAYCERKGIKIL